MSDNTETTDEVIAAMRRYADIVELGPPPMGKAFADLFREYADRIEAAAERDYEEVKSYFEKLHDGPSMVCTAKNCALRNAAEDIVEQVKAEASLGHFAPAVVEERPVGSSAKMREAILAIKEINDRRPHDAAGYEINDIIEEALSAAEDERERQPGNVAAMRAVLHDVDAYLGKIIPTRRENELRKAARAALAAPARNCDRFATANDAVEGYIAAHPHDDEPDASTYGSWLFAPAEGGAE